MKYGLIYGTVIAIVGVLLTTTFFVDIEAVSLDTEKTVIVKGDAISIQSKQLTLFIGQIDNIKDTNTVNYVFMRSDGTFEAGLACSASSKILKSSGLKKASVDFNTDDLVECLIKTSGNGDFLIEIEATGSSEFKKYDDTTCSPLGDIQSCSRIRGTSDGSDGTASGTVFGEALIENTSRISKINEKRTFWTIP